MDEGLEVDVVELVDDDRGLAHAPTAPPMSLQEARQITTDAFQRILKREPENSALDAYSGALLSGALTPRDMLIDLIESEEFRTNQSASSMSREGARAFTMEAFQRILKREPEESALEAYSGDLVAETLTPLDMILGLVESEEFRGKQWMSPQTALSFTAEAFRIILRREAEESALEAHSSALMSAALSPLGLIRNLIQSEEFGARATSQPVVARHIAQAVICTLTKEYPDPETLTSYARALENGQSLETMIRKTMKSDEFLYPDISVLAEQLIVAHLLDNGLNIPAPPRQVQETSPLSEDRMRAMLHALAMLAH